MKHSGFLCNKKAQYVTGKYRAQLKAPPEESELEADTVNQDLEIKPTTIIYTPGKLGDFKLTVLEAE